MMSSAPSRAATLKAVLRREEILVMPGVTDPWSARLAERASFSALFATGAGIANVVYGLPDIGLVSLAEMAAAVRRVCDAVRLPVIADADTGYGNGLNVARTVALYEQAGVAGVMIEDQLTPKKCGHFTNKSLADLDDMLQKLAAFQVARVDPDLLLVARTDAIEVAGFDEALRRGKAFARAGADLVFVEAPSSAEELERIPNEIDAPTLANMVEGGVTPLHTAHELQQMGYKAVFFANMAMRVSGRAMHQAFEVLRREGTTNRLLHEMMDWDERQTLAGARRWQELETMITQKAEAWISENQSLGR